MKLVSYLKEERDQLAVLVDGLLFDMEDLHPDLPNSMAMFLHYWEDNLDLILMIPLELLLELRKISISTRCIIRLKRYSSSIKKNGDLIWPP